MKQIILSVMVMAFAVAVQAGDSTTCQNKDKAGCCAGKVQTSIQAQTAPDKGASSCCAGMMKTSMQAQTSAAADKDAPACCSGKVKTSIEAQTSQATDKEASSCCAGKMKTSFAANGGCCKQTAAKHSVLMSPKAVSLASR
jgi:hypothetical protein